ncbi:hypothetical protein FHL15_008133 [Xylaria flabelliformis]|uniref:Uncharacterized protein n=1 Tax=Xylaria flabelliformis TaxID=2512241 RepID=A0A553HSK3_9PEZI|nr:hypothetical protein FHL15_008133 [Xylaria flabelliformis]
MAPKLELQIPPSNISSPDPEAKAESPQASLTPTPTHHSDNDTSELQQTYNSIMKRVAGYSPASLSPFSPFRSSSFSTSPSSSPYFLSPFQPLTPDNDTAQLYQNNLHSPPSIPSQRSYASHMYTNTYVLDVEDLERRLSLLSSSEHPSSREDRRHDREKARLARQRDQAYASVEAEESAALEALRQQILLDNIDDGEKRKDLGK